MGCLEENLYVIKSTRPNLYDKLEEILDYKQGWNMIRDEYIKLKNSNRDKNKKSFVLYLESIHNVYNHIQQENEESQPIAINLLRYW